MNIYEGLNLKLIRKIIATLNFYVPYKRASEYVRTETERT